MFVLSFRSIALSFAMVIDLEKVKQSSPNLKAWVFSLITRGFSRTINKSFTEWALCKRWMGTTWLCRISWCSASNFTPWRNEQGWQNWSSTTDFSKKIRVLAMQNQHRKSHQDRVFNSGENCHTDLEIKQHILNISSYRVENYRQQNQQYNTLCDVGNYVWRSLGMTGQVHRNLHPIKRKLTCKCCFMLVMQSILDLAQSSHLKTQMYWLWFFHS